MMTNPAPTPVKVALYGMDPRSYDTMTAFLSEQCQGIAEVVDAEAADVDILDADFPTAGDILAERRAQSPNRPLILLSLERLRIENTFFVQKPVMPDALIETLTQLRPTELIPAESEPQTPPVEALETLPAELPPPAESKRQHTVAYGHFLNDLTAIDYDDPDQIELAAYDPKRFFLGFVQSAFKAVQAEGRALQLQSMWKPMFLFPETQRIWLDADDKQLRLLAGMEQSKILSSNVTLMPFDVESVIAGKADDGFQDMEAFLWKLTLWTCKGRYPQGLDMKRPVYLKHWPNFTRLMLIPEGMRIAALLAQGPRAPLDIIKLLRIRAEYVFAFVSACHSIGILAQTTRHADELVTPAAPKDSQKQSLLRKILQKLRVGSRRDTL